jgi:hypothetical protein
MKPVTFIIKKLKIGLIEFYSKYALTECIFIEMYTKLRVSYCIQFYVKTKNNAPDEQKYHSFNGKRSEEDKKGFTILKG